MVLRERRGNPLLFPPARFPSCLGCSIWFPPACHAQCHIDMYQRGFVSHCPSKCQLLLQSRPAELPSAGWNPNSWALFRNERTSNLPSRSTTRGLMSCCYLQFHYKLSVFCPQRVFVSKDKIIICQMPIKWALLMHDTLSWYCQSPYFTPFQH